MEGTDALCPASLPLSPRSVPSWGDGEREDGGRVAFGKLARGWGWVGSAQAGQCRHWLPPLHSAICLASPHPPFSLFLSLSFIHSKTKRGKQGPHSAHPQPLPDPLSSFPQLTTPYHHQAICALASWLSHRSPSFIRLHPHTKTGAMFLKYMCIYFKEQLKRKTLFFGNVLSF